MDKSDNRQSTMRASQASMRRRSDEDESFSRVSSTFPNMPMYGVVLVAIIAALCLECASAMRLVASPHAPNMVHGYSPDEYLYINQRPKHRQHAHSALHGARWRNSHADDQVPASRTASTDPLTSGDTSYAQSNSFIDAKRAKKVEEDIEALLGEISSPESLMKLVELTGSADEDDGKTVKSPFADFAELSTKRDKNGTSSKKTEERRILRDFLTRTLLPRWTAIMGSLDFLGGGKSSAASPSTTPLGPHQSRSEDLDVVDSNNNFQWSGVGDNESPSKTAKDPNSPPGALRSQIAEEFQEVVDRMQSMMGKLSRFSSKRTKNPGPLSKSSGATPSATSATPGSSYWSKLVKRMRTNLGFPENSKSPVEGAGYGDSLNYIDGGSYKSKNKKQNRQRNRQKVKQPIQDTFDHIDWQSNQVPQAYQEPTAYAAASAYASEPISSPAASSASTLAGQVVPVHAQDVYSPYYYQNQDYYSYNHEDPSLDTNALYYTGEDSVQDHGKDDGLMVNAAGYTDGHQPDGAYPTYYTFIPAGAGTASVDTPAVVVYGKTSAQPPSARDASQEFRAGAWEDATAPSSLLAGSSFDVGSTISFGDHPQNPSSKTLSASFVIGGHPDVEVSTPSQSKKVVEVYGSAGHIKNNPSDGDVRDAKSVKNGKKSRANTIFDYVPSLVQLKPTDGANYQKTWVDRAETVISNMFDVDYHVRDVQSYVDSLWGMRRLRRRRRSAPDSSEKELPKLDSHWEGNWLLQTPTNPSQAVNSAFDSASEAEEWRREDEQEANDPCLTPGALLLECKVHEYLKDWVAKNDPVLPNKFSLQHLSTIADGLHRELLNKVKTINSHQQNQES